MCQYSKLHVIKQELPAPKFSSLFEQYFVFVYNKVNYILH